MAKKLKEDIKLSNDLLDLKKKPVKKVSRKKTPKSKAQPVDSAIALAEIIAQGMAEKKAEEIKILDMRKIQGASSDFFIICHAKSDKQVEAIATSIEEEVYKQAAEWPWHREGYENCEWILLDYINAVAHVFQEEKRFFYGVEELWGDAEIIPFNSK